MRKASGPVLGASLIQGLISCQWSNIIFCFKLGKFSLKKMVDFCKEDEGGG